MAGIDPNDAAALRTAYDSVKSSHDMLMSDVEMALADSGADYRGRACGTMYDHPGGIERRHDDWRWQWRWKTRVRIPRRVCGTSTTP